ncbi:hypothetical protein JAAARDRAFT_580714 [Jaapia argillacea MUCL 33604]|uniref:RING-type domain-containing protein n=1 Tax=Jaapia argillacea MUCL 33604 TaxID=933084 RepID=A0A067P6S0_9AGAM|nr:hypothetical protein JAAARDRAFT_580714 [Jaapia argillacea MUCL 33604]
MRVETTHHHESLRTAPAQFWPDLAGKDVRPNLNVSQLIELLRASSGDTPLSVKAGKKRAASPAQSGPNKRAKAADFGSESVLLDGSTSSSNNISVPIYRHIFDIGFSTDVFSDNGAANLPSADIEQQWAAEEEALQTLLREECDGETDPKTFALGPVHLRQLGGRTFGFSKPPRIGPKVVPCWKSNCKVRIAVEEDINPVNSTLFVPRIDTSFDLDSHDYRSPSHLDLLATCFTLQALSRVQMNAELFLVTLPPTSWDSTQGEMPYRVRLEVTVTLLPAIFAPIALPTKSKVTEAEEAQRRLLSYIFPPTSDVPSNYHGSTDIPFLFDVLGPAPSLDSKEAEERMQPDQLGPTLLPFQRRSVAWMLKREGKTVNDMGEVVPIPFTSSSSSPSSSTSSLSPPEWPLFWEQVSAQIDDDEAPSFWYFHRLTGRLSPTLPVEDAPLGGILAEEPGLGKTVECMSLVLLNPADEGRSPQKKGRWDREARVEVKEIKTTLIVTPPALAAQWVDELARHAPTLKVLVYDGWSKLNIPITEDDVDEERERRRKLAKKGKAKAKAKTNGKSRTARSKGKARVDKREDSDSDEDSMDVDDEDHPSGKEDAIEEDILDWCSFVHTFDICITTYPVLQSELGVARAPPIRPRRDVAVYSNVERPRSPVVMCEWYRVMMDEVQMVGGGKTEEMVGLIPRLSSFAVSGTPARASTADLVHVMKFLRVDNVTNPRMWARLLKPGFASQFEALFKRFAVRTMKLAVKDELTIPEQTRFLVGVELGKVERHVYDQNLEQALDELGLDARGVAASEGWQVDASVLRTWLRKLRGICTHPQVGQLQNQRDKLNKPGGLKTMAEVLEGMKDTNWRNMMENRKLKVHSVVRRAQLQQHDEQNVNRYRMALELLLEAEKDTNQLIDDLKKAIADHDTKGAALKKDAVSLREPSLGQQDAPGPSKDNGKGKGKADDESSSEGDDLPRTPAGEEHANKKIALLHRLRDCYVLLHRVKFYLGDVYHVLGNSHSADEDSAYQAAEKLRHDLLRVTEHSAIRAMTQLTADADMKGLNEEALLVDVPFLDGGGIRSHDLIDEVNEIIEELLNEQSALLWKWRTHIYSLLTVKLSSGDGEATGEEYSQSLETQGEAETYLQAYAALMADRRESLVAERTVLAAHNAKETKARTTKAAKQAALAALEDDLDIPEDLELQPEHEVLKKELSEARRALLERFNGRAVKSIMVDLSGVAAKISSNDDPEKKIAMDAAAALRRLMSAQATLMEKLDQDLAQFRKAFNERIQYFRQLQEISDSVSAVDWEGTIPQAIHEALANETSLGVQINTGRARHRYLDHLAKAQYEGTMDEDEEACILCRCEFVRGYITQCAHVFCEGCMKAWLARKEGKACPVCRVIINTDQLQRFSIADPSQDKKPELPPKIVDGEPIPRSSRQIQYNTVPSTLLETIEQMESHGSYGSKIQSLIRHLLYLQATDPGAKSIIFSAWADSLHIVEHALISNGISCLRIDSTKGKQNAAKRFRNEADILVLLLHGERENAGLNVTCASRVFMLESVVQHAFEIQAIARIDRMGQTRPTEVYCYYAEDTVERNILDLAAKQGLSLYTKENAAGTFNVSAFAGDSERKAPDSPSKRKKAQKGDFIFKTDDMLAILFPHMFEDIEYLVPVDSDQPPQQAQPLSQNGSFNAIAGPSRLTG